jgi:two-component system phosphate regulon sensor histidine kinase PhoR
VFEGVAAPTLVVRRPTGPDEAIRIVAANTAAGRLLDRPAATLIGADLDDVFTDAALAQLVRSDALGPQEAPGDEDAHTQIRFIRPDHAVSLDVAARPGPPDEGAPTLVLTLSDSTEAARAAQLKMDFAANAGHELRTPIAAIRLAAETMAAARGDAPMTERLRRMIEDNVRRLEEMIEDLLDLSRLESPELQVRARAYDLMDLSARIDELLAPRAVERDVSIQWRVEPEARVLVCDPLLLELVVRNLVDNAVKFARPGTSVTVEASAERTLNTPRPDAVIRVRDKGVGIPLKDQQRIFERFYQVDASRDGHNRRRGTGLGLAIVKHALRRLGGSIKVDSVWQQGTTMTVRLPATIGTTEELAAENQAHPDANEA